VVLRAVCGCNGGVNGGRLGRGAGANGGGTEG